MGFDFKYANKLEITKNASPAPIVSTTLLVNAGIFMILFFIFNKHPFFPVVTMNIFAFGNFLYSLKVSLMMNFYRALPV